MKTGPPASWERKGAWPAGTNGDLEGLGAGGVPSSWHKCCGVRKVYVPRLRATPVQRWMRGRAK